jgi:hypothetical protein
VGRRVRRDHFVGTERPPDDGGRLQRQLLGSRQPVKLREDRALDRRRNRELGAGPEPGAVPGHLDRSGLDEHVEQRLAEERVPDHPLDDERQDVGIDGGGAEPLLDERCCVLGRKRAERQHARVRGAPQPAMLGGQLGFGLADAFGGDRDEWGVIPRDAVEQRPRHRVEPLRVLDDERGRRGAGVPSQTKRNQGIELLAASLAGQCLGLRRLRERSQEEGVEEW